MVLLIVFAVVAALPMVAVPQEDECELWCTPPVFTEGASTTRSFDENIGGTASGSAIDIGAPVTATDADVHDDQPDFVFYEQLEDPDDDPGEPPEQGSDALLFDIDTQTGQLRTRPDVLYDWEGKRTYKVRMVACDNASNRDRIVVTINLNNLPEKPLAPTVTSVTAASTTKLLVRWDAPDNTGRPPITSYDLRYRLCPGDSGECPTDPETGWRNGPQNVTGTNAVISGLNLGKWYQVEVQATNRDGDGPWSDPRRAQTLGTEGPPVFLEDSPTRSFPENTPERRNIGSPVAAVGEGSLTYSLDATGAASFEIISSSGQIRTRPGVTYDFEDGISNAYTVRVKATDRGDNSADIRVDITLTDVLEPPERPAAPVVATESETSVLVTWTTRTYTDRPPVTSHDLQYRKGTSGGWTAGPLGVGGTSTPLTGLERGALYQVRILDRNDEGESLWSPSGSGRTNVPGNNLPVFPSTAPSLSFDESIGNERKQVMDILPPVTAVDDPGDTLSYSLEGEDANFFTIDSLTGQIKTRSRVYDYEEFPPEHPYAVSVKATDSHLISDTIALTIDLKNVAEPPLAPRMRSVSGRSTTSLTANWNPPSNNIGRPVIVGYDLEYRKCPSNQCPPEADTGWSDGPQGVTDTNTVVQNTGTPLDPDTLYQVRVRATNADGGGDWSPPGSGRTLPPPTFPAGPLNRSFRENTPAGRNIGAPVRATFGGPPTYTLEGADAGMFDIDESSGQIKTKAGETYDYEAESPDYSYSVVVRASDGSTSATVGVTIAITDEKERPLAPGTPVVTGATTTSLTVQWTAPDPSGRPPTTSYDVQYRQGVGGSWLNGPQDVEATTPTIEATIEGLRENTQYQVQVRGTNTDGDGLYSHPGAGSTSRETPVPNSPPTFIPPGPLNRNFPENTPPNRPIGDPVTATDPDTGDTLTYSLHGTDSASFNIDFRTGQLRTRSGVIYDYETKHTYMVTVRATDMSNAFATVEVTINLDDVDESSGGNGGGSGGGNGGGGGGGGGDDNTTNAEDEDLGPNNPPVYADVLIDRSFPEGTPPGRPVGAPVTAVDENGDPLTYTLEDLDAGSFDIDPATGQILTRPGVTYDYETRRSYTVTVRATDPQGESDTILVAIHVTDVNEAPVFGDTAVRSFAEDAPAGEAIGAPVTAHDDDGDPLTYSLEGADAASFDVDAKTGQIRTRDGVTYDYETRRSYVVTVRATDPQGASDTIPVTIHVTDANDPPAFGDAAVRSFAEDAPAGHAIGAPVTATDPEGDALTYTLEGADAASFDIDARSGQLRTRYGVTYDHEVRSSYTVEVWATDPRHASDRITVSIHVTDVNEGPLFGADTASRSFPENTPAGRAIGEPVTAADGDGDSLIYTLEGADAASFDIDAAGGQLRTASGVIYDYETRSSYSVVVRAADPHGAADTILVAIRVTDVNEPPLFSADTATRSFAENTPAGRAIGEPVTAADGDGDPLTYTLEGADAEFFDVDAGSGQIRTRAGVVYDYEARSQYAVTARATDPHGASDTILVTIHVTDVNEVPLFPAAAAGRSFPENTPPGQDIGAPVTAYDDDGDALAYTLEGPDAESFDVGAATGQLRTKSGVTYDYETRFRYAVTVRATDPSQASDTIVVTIDLTNVNEKPGTPPPPLVTAIEDTSTVLRVSWQAPGTNGGPALIGYDLQYRQGTGGPWLAWPHTGTRNAATITGLDASAAYQVRVRALNGETPGDWSAPGSGRTNATVDGWLARFGRTVAQDMLEGVEERLRSPRTAGLLTTIGGYGPSDRWAGEPLHGARGGVAEPNGIHGALAGLALGNPEAATDRGFRLLAEPRLLQGSGFELSSESTDSGSFGVWGRGGFSGFEGGAENSALDGEVTTTTLGADFAKGPWLAGLALSYSRGVGSHGRERGGDDVTATLAGVYPYAGLRVHDRLSIWGIGGFGAGGLTLTPPGRAGIDTDIYLAMLAIAARGALLQAANGFNLALAADGFRLRATSKAVPGLLAADEAVSRVRLGLEGFYARPLRNGSTLTPKLELGVRHDGGDAETGWGVDVSGGLLWSSPARGVHLELQARSLIGHQADSFRDWSLSGLVRYDPSPSSERGLSASLRSSVGSAPLHGAGTLLAGDTFLAPDALLAGDTFLAPDALARPAAASHAGLPAGTSHARLPAGASHGGELIAEAAYGFPILGGRFTGSPWAGAGLLESGRDYRLGYRVTLARPSAPDMALGIEAARREHHAANTEHTLALRLATRW